MVLFSSEFYTFKFEQISLVQLDGMYCTKQNTLNLNVHSAKRVGFFNIGSGRVGYWTKSRVAGRVRVG